MIMLKDKEPEVDSYTKMIQDIDLTIAKPQP